jgi:enoyl-CoA hydratase/carnithine racemase
MSEMVTYNVRNGIATVAVDNPPVNALSPGVPEGLEAALDRASADPAVRALVVMGAGRTFIAGADIAVLPGHGMGPGSRWPGAARPARQNRGLIQTSRHGDPRDGPGRRPRGRDGGPLWLPRRRSRLENMAFHRF